MKVLLPHGWDAPVGYANGIAVGGGTLVFVAGQVGWDDRQKFASAEIAPQFEQASAERARGARRGGRRAGPCLPHDGVLLRQARVPRRARRSSARSGAATWGGTIRP